MQQLQGVQSLEPHRVLQLHPRAPEQLIAEARRVLVERARRNGVTNGRLQEIEASYVLLTEGAARSPDGDAEDGGSMDYYQLLRIDRAADSDIVRTAYDVMRRFYPARSVEHFRLQEAFATLSHPQLRARYDLALHDNGAHALSRPRPVLVDVATVAAQARIDGDGVEPAPRQAMQPSLPASPKRGWFRGRGRSDEPESSPMEDRLVALRDEQLAEGWEPLAPPIPAPPPPAREAELLFLAGPRAGDRMELEGRTVILDRDGNEAREGTQVGVMASIWPQGERYMLRHGGAILIGGGRPPLPIVVLEDGDELAWGQHRLEFRNGRTVGTV